MLSTPDAIHALPATGYGLQKGKSADRIRQERTVQNIIQRFKSAQPNSDNQQLNREGTERSEQGDDTSLQGPTQEQRNQEIKVNYIKHLPEVFIADAGEEFIIDTGTNGFIVNDERLLTDFVPSKGNVKGINGKATQYDGTGKLKIRLRSDTGEDITVVVKGVYIPASPYNLLSPQLLVKNLKQQGVSVRCRYDDVSHTIKFDDPKDDNKPKQITSIAKPNHLFSVHVNQGYHDFYCHAVNTTPDWCCFAGAMHVIPPDDDNGTINPPMQLANDQGSGQTREASKPPNIIEDDTEMGEGASQSRTSEGVPPSEVSEGASEGEPPDASIPMGPQHADFTTDGVNLPKADSSVITMQRKQQRLATIHEQLGHFSFSKLQLMARAGLIPRELANIPPPVCPGCAYGKAHRKPIRHRGRQKHLRKATKPGEVVSMDQLVSPTKGFVPTHRGTPTTQRYIGATVFVDHFSDFTYVHLMTKMDGDSTVEAKNAFERIARSHGVEIQHYHSDNGLFDTKVFKQSVQTAKQTLSFCGPNAHHQNGKAENRIKDITTNARTALLHAAHRWPQAVNIHLWPAALKHYTNVRNSMPTRFTKGKRIGKKVELDQYDNSPLSIFSGTEVEPNLSHFHPFGCPVYVLEQALQAQHSHNKWSDRSKVGIFLCHSPSHATSVPLVLNTQTGNVAPQFHCIYDDNFATCKRDAKFVSLWQDKAKLSKAQPSDVVSRVSVEPTAPRTNIDTRVMRRNSQLPNPLPIIFNPQPVQQSDETDHEAPGAESDDERPSDNGSVAPAEIAPPDPPVAAPQQEPQATDNQPPVRRTRSGRAVRLPKTFEQYTLMATFLATRSPYAVDAIDPSTSYSLLQPDTEAHQEPHPLAMLSTFVATSDPDTMTLEEAMRQPDRDEFLKAMHKELSDHIGRKHWKVVPLKSVPKHKKTIPMVWSMKRKKDPLGNIIKWKARLCAGGHRSVEFVDYWSTYSPVVTWSTVRLMLTMALINNWHVRSIDFVLAYPQAPVKTDIFMRPPKVPPGFNIPDMPKATDRFTQCYKLIKNLYGLKDGGKTWFDFLNKGLIARGWKQSTVDTCLYTKPGIVLMVYVDDGILISADESLINREIKSLQESYTLTDDGVLKDYLGTHFVRNEDGSLEMTQPKMIERALEIVGLNKENVKMHDSPASDSKLLDNNPDAEERVQNWNYRSAVGCLSYIQAIIRPDITMAVQQCARFCNDPKREHEEAVKRICRYLVRTKDRGLTYQPDSSRGLECFVDADWAGSWQKRSANDPLSAHSRTGYVIMYAGCPIVWASKMQTLIALSTTEAEYIALSTALREVIGVMNLMNELKERGFTMNGTTPKVVCRTFEDNRSCIEIATNHRTRPRTKHLSVRLHHFRSHVTAGTIKIEHISTKEQIADLLTKPLPRIQYCKLRDALMSWSLASNREGVRE